MGTKNEAFNRREKIRYYQLEGMTEKLIAEKLDVSRSTIVRDIKYLKNETSEWLDELTKDFGYHYNYRINLERIENEIYQLNKIRENANTMERIKIGNLMVKLIQTEWDLLGKAPMVASFKKFIKNISFDKTKHFNGEKQKDGIPQYSISFLP